MIDIPQTRLKGRQLSGEKGFAGAEESLITMDAICDDCYEISYERSDVSEASSTPSHLDSFKGGFVSTVASRLDALLERFY